MIPIRVTKGRVLIRPDVDAQAIDQTDGGIYIAKTLEAAVDGEDAREAWYSGTVLAIGDRTDVFDVRPFLRRKLEDLQECATYDDVQRELRALLGAFEELPATRDLGFAVGDAVTYAAQAGQAVTIDGETYLILQESDILGVLEYA